MQFKTLGKTGITVSRLCLGCMSYGGGDLPGWALGTKGWHVNKEDAREHFKIALDAGINFFDTADVYSAGLSEEITGRALREMASRDDLVVATKVSWRDGQQPEQARAQPQAHHRRLRQFACAGSAWISSISTRSIAGTRVRRSKRRSTRSTLSCAPAKCAISAPAAWRLAALESAATRRKRTAGIASSRCRTTTISSIAKKSARRFRCASIRVVAIIPWSPLARGFLTGTRRRDGGDTQRSEVDTFAKDMYYSPDDFAVADAVAAVAKQRGASPAQVAWPGFCRRPASPLPSSAPPRRSSSTNLIAAVDLKLTPDEVAALEKPYRPHGILGHAQPSAKSMAA